MLEGILVHVARDVENVCILLARSDFALWLIWGA